MKNYDPSTLTRDQLYYLLRAAKDEIVKYNTCQRDVKNCKERIEKERRDKYELSVFEMLKDFFETESRDLQKEFETVFGGCMIIVTVTFWLLWFSSFVGFIYHVSKGIGINNINKTIIFLCCFLITSFFFIIIFNIHRKKIKRKVQIAQSNYEQYVAKLAGLEEKEKEAMNELKSIWLIPSDYRYEYALTMMLNFIENGIVHNWKEVVALYEKHLFRLTVEENTQIAAVTLHRMAAITTPNDRGESAEKSSCYTCHCGLDPQSPESSALHPYLKIFAIAYIPSGMHP